MLENQADDSILMSKEREENTVVEAASEDITSTTIATPLVY